MSEPKKVVKTIKITREQATELRKDLVRPVHASKFMADILKGVIANENENMENAWDAVARLCSYEDQAEVREKNLHLMIDWANSSIIVSEIIPWETKKEDM